MRGPFALVVGAGLALLIIGIIFSLAPTVGGSIDDAGDAESFARENSWNPLYNTDLQEGGDFFSANQTWVTLLFLGLVAGVVIMMFMRW
jgi:hypothetical protein